MQAFLPTPLSGTLWHPTLGQVRYSIKEVSDDPDEQVAATVNLMGQYASQDASSPTIQQDVAHASQSDDSIGDTFRYLCRDGVRGMRFVRDEVTGLPWEQLQQRSSAFRWRPVVETLIRPADQATLPNPQGDCDDFAQYGAAHLIARGIKDVRYATAAADPEYPELFTHVYLVAYPKDGPYAGMRVPVDLSHGPYPGWEVPNTGKFCEWPVSGGLGLFGWGAILGGSYLLYRALSGRSN